MTYHSSLDPNKHRRLPIHGDRIGFGEVERLDQAAEAIERGRGEFTGCLVRLVGLVLLRGIPLSGVLVLLYF